MVVELFLENSTQNLDKLQCYINIIMMYMDFENKKTDCACCITAIWQHKLNAYKLLLPDSLQVGPDYDWAQT